MPVKTRTKFVKKIRSFKHKTQRIRDNTEPQINYSKTIFADEHKTITHVNR